MSMFTRENYYSQFPPYSPSLLALRLPDNIHCEHVHYIIIIISFILILQCTHHKVPNTKYIQ